jgi:hypothetical protein
VVVALVVLTKLTEQMQPETLAAAAVLVEELTQLEPTAAVTVVPAS